MKNKNISKILSMLLTICLLLGALPVAAVAADGALGRSIGSSGVVNVSTEAELTTVFRNLNDNDELTIKLMDNIDYSIMEFINNNKILFDLNGYILNFTVFLQVTNSTIDIDDSNGGELNFNNTDQGAYPPLLSVNESSSVTVSNISTTVNQWALFVSGNSTVTVKGDISSNRIGVAIGLNSTAQVTVDGKIDASIPVAGNISVYNEYLFLYPEETSSKIDYFEYKHVDALNNISYVWAKGVDNLYGITVGGVYVTADNKDNITGRNITGKVSYNFETNTLTLNNAVIYGDLPDEKNTAIRSFHDLNIVLIGNSIFGVKPTDQTSTNEYSVSTGIDAENQSITLSGSGNLTIYDQSIGIEAKNITVNMGGILTVLESGGGKSCCLKADGGTLTINSGTIDLSSVYSNGLSGDKIIINGGTITSFAQGNPTETGIHYSFNTAPTISPSYKHIVKAGSSASTARIISNPTAETFTKSLYVKIEPTTTSSSSSFSSSDSSNDSSGWNYTAAQTNATTNITKSAATTAAKNAIKAAKAAGLDTATVRIKNVGNISLDALKAMVASGTDIKFQADSMDKTGKTITARISLDPAKSTRDLNLTASVSGSRVKAVKAFFEKWFSNKVSVLSLGQKGSFGQSVDIAAKLDLSGMDTDNLVFYIYDQSANSYKRLNVNYRIDSSGYVRFTTQAAGDIVVSDGPLTLK